MYEEDKDLFYHAKVLLMVSKREDAIRCVQEGIQMGALQGIEDAHTVVTLYENIVKSKLNVYQRVKVFFDSANQSGKVLYVDALDLYIQNLTESIHVLVQECIDFVNEFLDSENGAIEEEIYFNKIKGDFYQTLVDITDEDSQAIQMCMDAYKTAYDLAEASTMLRADVLIAYASFLHKQLHFSTAIDLLQRYLSQGNNPDFGEAEKLLEEWTSPGIPLPF